ncbi:lantibiotic dehydratase [Actinomadura chibensis]|uniref:Lanthionine biosynthesis protein LanB n=1 Tax=Actinomadura chibensis TaxID=392828 RepID=A0A5D0N8Q3_9ACTN|nr:lantibiotic dehydratase [Actinomadura chibensis]TYB40793.1 Lanthionine biosynthesis protein LanB [Actinomadura chibensis]
MSGRLYRCVEPVFLRAAAFGELHVAPCPDLSGDAPEQVAQWLTWLRDVWANGAVADAISYASPALAQEVRSISAADTPDVRRARRTVSSVARYVMRMTSRATPFGLFAGVATASFGQTLVWRWGSDHRAVASVSGAWSANLITRLESCPEIFRRLRVVANDLCFWRGDRLVVPYPPRRRHPDGPVAEISVRCTTAVQMAVEAARSPIRCSELAAKLAVEFPSTSLPSIEAMLTDLVKQHVLISNLRPPATVVDVIGHLVEQLEAAPVDDIPQAVEVLTELREIRRELARHNDAIGSVVERQARASVVTRMRELSADPAAPIGLDLHLKCRVVLPRRVAQEAEAAVSALARLSAHPFGSPAWQAYHTRFFERYGVGTLVPVLELVNPDVGLGLPAGYLGGAPQLRPAISARDERLLALAQSAVLDGRHEVVVDEDLLGQLTPKVTPRWPAHREIRFQLQAASAAALNAGDFSLVVSGVSRGAATMIGRFVGSLSRTEQASVKSMLGELPVDETDALVAQFSFAPLTEVAANVSRVPELLPHVVGLGEHPPGNRPRIPVGDLAVGCEGDRLYLASMSLKRRVEPVVPHALDLSTHAPPVARFLAEIGNAQSAVLTGFDWGAANHLPFLPRLRYGRAVLTSARWVLDAADVPSRDASWSQWDDAFQKWRASRRLPNAVLLVRGDRRLRLDLSDRGQLALLRANVTPERKVVLEEAVEDDGHGWCGGRAHEIVVQMARVQSPDVHRPVGMQMARRGDGHLPGASPWLFVKLYGSPERQTELLTRHFPDLLAAWSAEPRWWFVRYRDPEPHIRLRIALADSMEFGIAAARVGSWAQRLRRSALLRDVQITTYYPETGRWGNGLLMAAAEEVFSADSRAVTAQLGEGTELHSQTLSAAQFLAMAIAFKGTAELGVSWATQYVAVDASEPIPRDLLNEAVRLADPTNDWISLRSLSGGQAIVDAWRLRDQALASYGDLLSGSESTDSDAVLASLLHAHHMRAIGPDSASERICLRLARAAAQAWTAQRMSEQA